MQMPAGSLPVTEQVAAEIVSLPMYPELSDGDIDEVVQAIFDYSATPSV
jgi:dTDP-4-amino-4,6-dideoxygalactose transaminase